MYTSAQIRALRTAPFKGDKLMTTPSSYVVVVPWGTRERVAYGLTVSLSKRAAGQLSRAVQSLYKGKPRVIMVKTAVKDGILA